MKKRVPQNENKKKNISRKRRMNKKHMTRVRANNIPMKKRITRKRRNARNVRKSRRRH